MPGRPKRRAAEAERQRVRRVKREALDDVHTALVRVVDGGFDITIANEASTADILNWAMRRVHVAMLWAAKRADGVPVDQFWVHKTDAWGNDLVEPNKWFQLERAMREEAVRLATKMVELGLAERQVALEEAKAVMVAQAVRTAAEAAGLTPVQVTRLGEELRKGLASGSVGEVAA